MYDFGLISCDELTNIKVNIEDKKLTPLDLTKKVHKKTLDKRTDVRETLRRQDFTVALASYGDL